jgi:hypothetical protein
MSSLTATATVPLTTPASSNTTATVAAPASNAAPASAPIIALHRISFQSLLALVFNHFSKIKIVT